MRIACQKAVKSSQAFDYGLKIFLHPLEWLDYCSFANFKKSSSLKSEDDKNF